MVGKKEPSSAASGPSQPRGSIVSVPDHKLLRLIGRGSYGEVWLAKNTLGIFRAIKIVDEKSFRNKRPFEREFNGVQKFEPVSRQHEGLMNILLVGRNDVAGYFYCVMELADDIRSGQVIDPDTYQPRTLTRDISAHKRLTVGECRRIGAAIALALDFLHMQGLIHRDVKPSNIVFVNGIPKLADIGLVVEQAEARSYVGTEGFIPPEGPGTPQADIYSLGKVLYEISTGMDRQDFPQLPDDLGDSVEQSELFQLNKIILKACRTDINQRYKSARAMVAHLEHLGSSPGTANRLLTGFLGAGAIAGLIAVLFGTLLLLKEKRKADRLESSPPRIPYPKPTAIACPDGLVAWWKGDGEARDSIGTNDGLLVNGVSFATGKVGQAFSFDGINDYVRVPKSPGLDVTNITIELWMKIDTKNSMTSLQGLVVNDFYLVGISHGFGPRNLGVAFALSTDGGASCSSESFPDTATENNSGAPVSVGRWHHAAATYNGTNLQLYIDGSPWGKPVYHTGAISPALSATFLTLGAEDGRTICKEYRGRRYFNGLMDEVAIYNRALSASEILSIYQAGSAGKMSPAAPNQNCFQDANNQHPQETMAR